MPAAHYFSSWHVRHLDLEEADRVLLPHGGPLPANEGKLVRRGQGERHDAAWSWGPISLNYLQMNLKQEKKEFLFLSPKQKTKNQSVAGCCSSYRNAADRYLITPQEPSPRDDERNSSKMRKGGPKLSAFFSGERQDDMVGGGFDE